MNENMIFNLGGSGGGAALNFKVVGNPQPASPGENTIWVNTDVPIGAWYFSATQPENLGEGDVWFPVGTASSVEFNALKKNGIQVYPLSAKQMVSGSLVNVEAKIYQGGAWNELAHKYYLFKSGEGEVVPINVTVDSNQKYTQTDESIVFSCSSSADFGYAACTEESHDITTYSSLCIEHAFSNYGTCRIGLYTQRFTHSTASTDMRPAELVLTKSGTAIVEKLDISAFKGNYYLGFNGGKLVGSLFNFWLE